MTITIDTGDIIDALWEEKEAARCEVLALTEKQQKLFVEHAAKPASSSQENAERAIAQMDTYREISDAQIRYSNASVAYEKAEAAALEMAIQAKINGNMTIYETYLSRWAQRKDAQMTVLGLENVK